MLICSVTREDEVRRVDEYSVGLSEFSKFWVRAGGVGYFYLRPDP